LNTRLLTVVILLISEEGSCSWTSLTSLLLCCLKLSKLLLILLLICILLHLIVYRGWCCLLCVYWSACWYSWNLWAATINCDVKTVVYDVNRGNLTGNLLLLWDIIWSLSESWICSCLMHSALLTALRIYCSWDLVWTHSSTYRLRNKVLSRLQNKMSLLSLLRHFCNWISIYFFLSIIYLTCRKLLTFINININWFWEHLVACNKFRCGSRLEERLLHLWSPWHCTLR
jgi:hypothetical protein